MATIKKKKEQLPVKLKKSSGVATTTKVANAKSRKKLFALVVILLLSFLAYLPVLNNGFLNWDDYVYIRDNITIHSINLKKIFSEYFMGNYHPLTMLIYSIEYHFFGLSTKAFHGANLLIHLINVILVFETVSLLSNKNGVALIAALLFGIHPMHVESVAWASELKDLLYVLFFFASYYCYLKYLNSRQRTFYYYCLLLFLLSLFSKAMAASLPVVLLLTDYFKGRKIDKSTLLEKAPFFALSIIFGIVALFAQRSFSAIHIEQFPFTQRIIFASYGFITYLIKLLLPLNLSALYPYPMNSGEAIPFQYYGYLILLSGLVISVLYSLRFTKKIFFGIGFFAITVFLVLQLLPVGGAIMADRYSYLASFGIFFLAGEGAIFIWNSKAVNRSLKTLFATIACAAFIFYSVNTYAQSEIWKSNLTFWNDVISKYQSIYIAYYNRGMALSDDKRYEEALNDYNTAIKLHPELAALYMNRGIALSELKRFDEGYNDLNKAIQLKPDYAGAFFNRGYLFERNGNKYADAINDYNKAIEIQPDFVEAYRNRGVVLCKLKQYDEGVKNFNKAIELDPRYAATYYNRGFAEYYLGKAENACSDFQKASKLGSKEAENAYLNLCH